MQINPVEEWQRLTTEYREKCDEELRELASNYADLTETAQQVLRSEMQSRGLGDPANPKSGAASQSTQTKSPNAPLALSNAPWGGDPVDIAFGQFSGQTPQLIPDDPDSPTENKDAPHDYTWMTELCELALPEEAKQLQEVLRRADIDCWIRFNGSVYPYVPSTAEAFRGGLSGLHILVAADQLEQARNIAAQPIPQEIVDESKQEVPDFVEPKCPKCGAEDPILESVDPENTWRCEQCDAQWTETLPSGEGAAPKG